MNLRAEVLVWPDRLLTHVYIAMINLKHLFVYDRGAQTLRLQQCRQQHRRSWILAGNQK